MKLEAPGECTCAEWGLQIYTPDAALKKFNIDPATAAFKYAYERHADNSVNCRLLLVDKPDSKTEGIIRFASTVRRKCIELQQKALFFAKEDQRHRVPVKLIFDTDTKELSFFLPGQTESPGELVLGGRGHLIRIMIAFIERRGQLSRLADFADGAGLEGDFMQQWARLKGDVK